MTSTTSAPRATAARASAWPCLPDGAVAQEADRVEVLAGAAGATRRRGGRPGRAAAAPRASTARHSRASSAGSGSRPLPLSAPVSRPTAGLDDEHAARAQRRDVGLRGRVLPHLGVHRRREHDRAARGEQRVGEQVVGEPVRGAGQQVGGGRGDDDEVGGLADPHVRHLVDVVPVLVADRAARTAPPRSARRRTASALAVGTTRTSCPVSVSRRSSSHALYAAIPPGDAEDDAAGRLGRAACTTAAGSATCSWVSRPALISRSAIDSGFSWTWVSTSGPTYSSRPSPSWE